VNGACDRVTYQKLVTRSRYVLVRCAVGIWLSHQRVDTVTAGAGLDVQRHAARPHLLSRYGVTLRGNVTSVDPPLHCVFELEFPLGYFYHTVLERFMKIGQCRGDIGQPHFDLSIRANLTPSVFDRFW